jgi:hypothetical protein
MVKLIKDMKSFNLRSIFLPECGKLLKIINNSLSQAEDLLIFSFRKVNNLSQETQYYFTN